MKSFRFASKHLEEFQDLEVDTIGGLYALVMLLLLQLESCVKMRNSTRTIFRDVKQLDAQQWYVTQGVSKGKLFAVIDVKTALAALIQISYEGEGGVACCPFLSAKNATEALDMNLMSKSHFIKFQEMHHERELEIESEKPPPWSGVTCLDQSNRECGCMLRNGTLTYATNEPCLHFCFTGRAVAVDEQLDVWPLKSFPVFPNSSLDLTQIPKETKNQADHFDETYTTLLHCLGKQMRQKSCL